jgi:hypothetical protein
MRETDAPSSVRMCGQIGIRSSANVDEVPRSGILTTRIDAGGSKLKARTSDKVNKFSSVEYRKTSFVTSIANDLRASNLIKGAKNERRKLNPICANQ